MEGAARTSPPPERRQSLVALDEGRASAFSQQWVTITKQEHIDLTSRASYWEAQHARAKSEIEKLRQEAILKDAKIKDLQNRLFGKKSEKNSPLKSEKDGKEDTPSKRKRGQQPGSQGHGRTKRPDLPIVHDQSDLADEEKRCPTCGLPHLPTPALDEHSEVIEVEVKAHVRRMRRMAYTRNPGCTCEDTPAILTAPPPARLIARSNYAVSFWVEVILGKYRYGQPSNRSLQDLEDQGLPVSPGTLAGGLQALAPLFEPVLEAWYCKQMSEQLFHNDETRWEVFVDLPGKVGTRWYLWVTRSPSVVFYCIDPSRSAASPARFLPACRRTRPSSSAIGIAPTRSLPDWRQTSCSLSAGPACAPRFPGCRTRLLRAPAVGAAVEGAERHALPSQPTASWQWDPEQGLTEQCASFNPHPQALQTALQCMHEEATRIVASQNEEGTPGERAARASGPEYYASSDEMAIRRGRARVGPRLIQERTNETQKGACQSARALVGAHPVCRAPRSADGQQSGRKYDPYAGWPGYNPKSWLPCS
jgi:hypothetical protein